MLFLFLVHSGADPQQAATDTNSHPRVFAASALFPVAGFAVLLLGVFPAEQSLLWWTVFLTGAGVNFGIGLSLGILTVMLADVVDYGEFKLGSRNESILFVHYNRDKSISVINF